jgi:hypothetical protein
MGDARLNDVGIVVREILAARGIELTGERSFAEEFRSQGFEEAVGRQASKQNMQNWFFAAGEWRHVPTGFGPWFAEAYDLTDKEIADLCYVCIMRRLPAGYSDPYA